MKNKQALTVTELQLDGTFVSTVFDFFFFLPTARTDTDSY